MKQYFYVLGSLLLAILLFLFSYFLDKSPEYWDIEAPQKDSNLKNVEHVLHTKEQQVESVLNEFTREFERIDDKDELSFSQKRDSCQQLFFNSEYLAYEDHGLVFLIYENDSLLYWSDNSVPIPPFYSLSPFGDFVINLENAIYVARIKKVQHRVFVGLILVKHSYSYQNEFLKNTYYEDFELSPNIEFSRLHTDSPGAVNVHNKEGDYLFTLTPIAYSLNEKPFYYTVLVSYFLSVVFLLFFFYRISYYLVGFKRGYWWLYLLALGGLAFRVVTMRGYFIPASVEMLEIYSPMLFAASAWAPSLPDFLINNMLIFLFCFSLSRHFKLPSHEKNRGRAHFFKNMAISFVFVAITVAYFVLVFYSLKGSVIDSTVSFELYKIFSINSYTFIGLLGIGLLIAGFLLFTDTAVQFSLRTIGAPLFVLFVVLATVIILLLYPEHRFEFDYISLIFLFSVVFSMVFMRLRNLQYKYYTYIFFALFGAVYTEYSIATSLYQDEREERPLLVKKVTIEQEKVTEFLLTESKPLLLSDTAIKSKVRTGGSTQEIEEHIKSRYNINLWNYYNLKARICSPSDTIQPADTIQENCYQYYQNLQEKKGTPLENDPFLSDLSEPDFYFMDYQNGRINYLGWLKYYYPPDSTEYSLFLELKSKMYSDVVGYPAVLIDEEYNRSNLLSGYSYAKYIDGHLISQSGDFQYSLERENYGFQDVEMAFFDRHGYNHMIFNAPDDFSVIISKPNMQPLDIIVSFSYIFMLFFVFVNLVLPFVRFPAELRKVPYDLRFKIQFSMIGILSLLLLLIGVGTVYYNINEYREKHHEFLQHKIESVCEDLRYNFRNIDNLKAYNDTASYKLDDLLLKYFQVFSSDVHLFDPAGNLLATTRHEVFVKKLKGEKMASEAYRSLHLEEKRQFIHNEEIGGLKYLSAYMPFENSDGKLLAYVNLPYFWKQEVLSEEISNFIVAIINIYALMVLLTFAIAIFISNRISQPLKLIQSKFREIELGKPNEQILYTKNDEIGSLIREYNRMLDELSKSADLLAKSEREGAWREMAKQIAHEIKNPLTPMKLSVQHLQRAWHDKDQSFAQRLERISTTLIEQIERLSAIATGFSNFAKIPRAKNEEIDLVQVLKSTIQLYEDDESIQLSANLGLFENPVKVFADPEQLSRVLINLITNARQAKRDGSDCQIRIELLANQKRAVTKIRDNGVGIPESIRDKLFQPNFTTRSSGMGLGLAIVKNIIENAEGKIWFETQVNVGTTFFIELPVITEE